MLLYLAAAFDIHYTIALALGGTCILLMFA